MRLRLRDRFRSVGQRQDFGNDRSNFSGIDQLRDLGKLSRVGMRRKRRAADLMFLQLRFIATRHNRHDDSVFFHHAIRTRERIAAHWVEHNIDIVCDLFELLFRVIDCDVGAELLQ